MRIISVRARAYSLRTVSSSFANSAAGSLRTWSTYVSSISLSLTAGRTGGLISGSTTTTGGSLAVSGSLTGAGSSTGGALHPATSIAMLAATSTVAFMLPPPP
jgi:hypothetical protein